MEASQNNNNDDFPDNNQEVQPKSSQLNVHKHGDSLDSEPNEVKENLPSSAAELLGEAKKHGKNVDLSKSTKPKQRAKKNGADIQERACKLEYLLQSADLSEKAQNSLWCNPVIFEMLGLISDQLGVPKGEVVHMAMIMFYRQCFSDERRMINDLGTLLNNLSLQTEQLGLGIQSFEETAQTAVELELSPYQGSQEFDI